ncbi:hypothetical protein KO506_12690 [Polaribacter vadi]|uniref:hypothetical protein n=1 Tax=Polaribacter TaxID=52959 RepID=UPI001C08C348|nr:MULTISPECIES: hypothetical protein [Polaribacter]MBU3012266.1 hypothetical protein [Polaribacter vadi]MDO6742083.1 hypothetical protein [Polaribacter sp. 1_MG-2023]
MALEINIGEEYKIKIEKTEDFEKSIFKEVYTQATKNVEEIILQANTVSSTKSISNDDYNNVIAFTGERGTGKSSSMISFADALKNKKSKDTFWSATPNLEKAKIKSLDIIDPSLFRNEDKLFEIIISKMFSKFQKKLKKENTIKNDRKRDLIKQFQKVFNNLKVVHNGKSDVYEKEAIEALSDLAFGTNLKENFKKLVDEYLLCMYGIDNSKDKKGFLLIPIDDFDLNISGAYEMLEDIRQFLIQSNVLILIAFKMEQLQDSINNEIIKEYDMIFKYGEKANIYLSENISNKSNKYLDKLFPLERRFNTPILIENNISTQKMNLYDSQYEIELKEELNTKDVKVNKDKIYYIKNQTIENTFLGLVYRKTNILIAKNKFEKNIIVPNTLRDLTNTITLIYRESNINSFKTYLNKEIGSNLSQEEVYFFKELDKASNTTLNQFILNWIGINKNGLLFNSDYDPTFEDENEISRLTKIKKYYNASFGDVLSVLREIKSNILVTDIKNLQFVSYLKIYYSIRFTELFKNNFNIENLQILTNDRLTNNSIKYFPTIRDKPKGLGRRDYFVINKSPLDLYQYIVDLINEITPNNNNYNEIYLWFTHFLNFIGYGSKDNKYYVNNITDDIKERTGNKYETVTFSAISILNNLNNSDKLIKQYVPHNILVDIKDSNFYLNLKQWNIDLNKDYYLVYNINLFDEILNKLSDYSSSKDSLGDNYGKRLHVYLYDGLKEISEKLSIKYNIDLRDICNNPFFDYWNDNYSVLNGILDSLFNFSSEKSIKSLYKLDNENLNTINRFIKHSLPSLTKKKLAILINKLAKSKNSPNQRILNELWKLRNSLNNNNLEEIKNDLRDLLNNLKSNG